MIASHLLLGAVALFVLGSSVLVVAGAWLTWARDSDNGPAAIIVGAFFAILSTAGLAGIAKQDAPACAPAPASLVERAP